MTVSGVNDESIKIDSLDTIVAAVTLFTKVTGDIESDSNGVPIAFNVGENVPDDDEIDHPNEKRFTLNPDDFIPYT